MRSVSIALLALVGALSSRNRLAHAEEPLVRAVYFYSPTCPHCQKVSSQDLPPLLEAYGERSGREWTSNRRIGMDGDYLGPRRPAAARGGGDSGAIQARPGSRHDAREWLGNMVEPIEGRWLAISNAAFPCQYRPGLRSAFNLAVPAGLMIGNDPHQANLLAPPGSRNESALKSQHNQAPGLPAVTTRTGRQRTD